MNIIRSKRIAVILLFMTNFLCLSVLKAQHQHHQGECGSVAPTTAEQTYMDATERFRQNYQSYSREGTVYIPVRHIIVRRDDGTGGVSSADLATAMQELNAAYAVADVEFYECSRVYADDTDFYNYDRADENLYAPTYEQANVINIYYCGSIVSNGNGLCGYAAFPGGTDRVFMAKGCLLNGSTYVHEFGHFFGLYHTHQSGNELVNGSNCTTAGDRLCDTPADPNLSGNTDVNCIYTGTATDANGDSYSPMVENYMSYARKHCRTTFTAGQISRIRYSAANDRNYLECSCNQYNYVGYRHFGLEIGNEVAYSASANTSVVAVYNCDNNPEQFRVGNCSAAPNTGGDYVSVTYDVPQGTDKLRLVLRGGWQNSTSEVHVDGVYQANFSLASNCAYTYIDLNNVSNYTQDGQVVIKLVDPSPGCTGDFILDEMYVYSGDCRKGGHAKLPYFTNFNSGVIDDYWVLHTDSEFGRVELTTQNGPYSGAYHLVMDVSQNNNYALNGADLKVDLSTVSDPTLYFRWKEFNDETHTTDGVYISDDGGENFVKIYSLTNGTNNTWHNASLDLATLASNNGLSLTDEFVIRFQQYDNYGATTDGIALDYIYVYNNPAPLTAINSITDADAAVGDLEVTYEGYELAHNNEVTANELTPVLEGDVQLFPNPAQEHINLLFNDLSLSTDMQVDVVDMLGAIQGRYQFNAVNNGDMLTLPVDEFSAGVYTLKITTTKGKVIQKRFVVSD